MRLMLANTRVGEIGEFADFDGATKIYAKGIPVAGSG
jgi:hypothetical protein